MRIFKILPVILLMTSCAAGSIVSGASGVSGYSFKSGESDKLSITYETSLVYRIKKELKEESYDRK